MDALEIDRAVIGGYDWGGRGCCVVSALWPERVVALVSGNSYNIQNIARSMEPVICRRRSGLLVSILFPFGKGRRSLTENRRDLIRHCWSLWSPKWGFDDAIFAQSAAAFDNPDFVDAIHSYRHRYGLVPGDPAVAYIETQLTAQPPITVPAPIDGDLIGVSPALPLQPCAVLHRPARTLGIPRCGPQHPAGAPRGLGASGARRPRHSRRRLDHAFEETQDRHRGYSAISSSPEGGRMTRSIFR